MLRDALADLELHAATETLEVALRHGAARDGALTVVNVNRQRPTGQKLWDQLA